LSSYLVLGSNGLLGHVVSLYLRNVGEDVTCLSRTYSSVTNNQIMNFLDQSKLQAFMDKYHFDWIINCAGVLNKSAEENVFEAISINSLLPHYLVHLTKNKNTRVIQISTDCVFDGKNGPYSESSIPNAQNNYGITKRLGELKDERSLTIRTSIVGPEFGNNRKGLFDWFMRSKDSINGFNKAIWSGVTTIQLAKFIHSLKNHDIHGVINYVNNESISKFDLLSLFNKVFNKSITIKIDNEYKINKSLITDNTKLSNNIFVPSYLVMVNEMKTWIIDHKDIYDYEF
jgi:dTDP-4-dehydrorhamnose reductase